MKFKHKNTEGFSLVELIVVIVILAILIGATISGVYKYVNEARRSTDIANAQAIERGLSMLAVDRDINRWMEEQVRNSPTGFYGIMLSWQIDQPVEEFIRTWGAVPIIVNGETVGNFGDKIIALMPDGVKKIQCADYFILAIYGTKNTNSPMGYDIFIACDAMEDTNGDNTLMGDLNLEGLTCPFIEELFN